MNTIPPPCANARAGFDLAVCYRIYPGVSRNPIFGFKNKLALSQLNLESFKTAVGDLKIKLWVLLDNCPPAYAEQVQSIFPDTATELIPLGGEGNGSTFIRQVDILSAQTAADLVYFAEDDYLYLPRALERTADFMRHHPEADFVTPYDHADFYSKYVHRFRGAQIWEGDCRWRTVASTCLTFMARRTALAASAAVFKTYPKNSDLGLWLALTKRRVANPWSWLRSLGDGPYFCASHALAWRYAWRHILFGKRRTLWAPAPSLATHMEAGGLAPGTDWERIFGERAAALKASFH
jgi:hypothetical protein